MTEILSDGSAKAEHRYYTVNGKNIDHLPDELESAGHQIVNGRLVTGSPMGQEGERAVVILDSELRPEEQEQLQKLGSKLTEISRQDSEQFYHLFDQAA